MRALAECRSWGKPVVCSHAHSRRGGCCGEPPSFFVCSVRSAISRNISGLSRHSRGRRISVTAISVAAFGPLAGLSISLIRAKAKAVGSSRSLYVPLYRCGDLNHVGGADFNNRFVNLQYATRSQSSRPGSAPTPTPARTRCRRAEGATKCRHWAECFGGGMTGRSCGGSQDRPTLTSHERAVDHFVGAQVTIVVVRSARLASQNDIQIAPRAEAVLRNALFKKSLLGRRTSRRAPASPARTTARSPSPRVGHASVT
jgi:hypothetical protein